MCILCVNINDCNSSLSSDKLLSKALNSQCTFSSSKINSVFEKLLKPCLCSAKVKFKVRVLLSHTTVRVSYS